MISYLKFKTNWIKHMNPSITYPNNIINGLPLSTDSKDFLLNVGLPKYCFPFLTFKSISEGALTTLNKKFNLSDEYYNKFLYIGFNNELDILSIESTSGKIKCIDFKTFNEIYVNNSILTFAKSLLEYFLFITEVTGNCGYLKKNCPVKKLHHIENTLNNIDKYSLIKDTFWGHELEQFYN